MPAPRRGEEGYSTPPRTTNTCLRLRHAYAVSAQAVTVAEVCGNGARSRGSRDPRGRAGTGNARVRLARVRAHCRDVLCGWAVLCGFGVRQCASMTRAGATAFGVCAWSNAHACARAHATCAHRHTTDTHSHTHAHTRMWVGRRVYLRCTWMRSARAEHLFAQACRCVCVVCVCVRV